LYPTTLFNHFVVLGRLKSSGFYEDEKLFAAERRRKRERWDATKEGAAVIGFTAAFAAYGGFFIPKSYGTSIDLTGGVNAALIGFIISYAICAVLNWWYYTRKGAEAKC